MAPLWILAKPSHDVKEESRRLRGPLLPRPSQLPPQPPRRANRWLWIRLGASTSHSGTTFMMHHLGPRLRPVLSSRPGCPRLNSLCPPQRMCRSPTPTPPPPQRAWVLPTPRRRGCTEEVSVTAPHCVPPPAPHCSPTFVWCSAVCGRGLASPHVHASELGGGVRAAGCRRGPGGAQGGPLEGVDGASPSRCLFDLLPDGRP